MNDASSSSSWSPQDRELAEKVVKNLQSDKYKDKNYLFLHPFDLSQVPGYVELVGPPLDLHTVSSRLQNNAYATPTEYWKELADIFTNAIKYHTDKPATKWIAKLAKDMLRMMGKERKSLEKKRNSITSSAPTASLAATPSSATAMAAGAGGLTLKLSRLPMASTAASTLATHPSQVGSTTSSSSSNNNNPPAEAVKVVIPVNKPRQGKQFLALQQALQTPPPLGSEEIMPSPSSLPPPPAKKPKVSLKLKLPTAANQKNNKNKDSLAESIESSLTETPVTVGSTDLKPSPTSGSGPKLKLKLSLSKGSSGSVHKSPGRSKAKLPLSTPGVAPTPVPSTAALESTKTPAPATAAPPKITLKASGGGGGPSRGKELPKAVQESQQLQQQQIPAKPKKPRTKVKKPTAAALKKQALAAAAAASNTPSALLKVAGAGGLSLYWQKQCAKIVAGLRRRHHKHITWFAQPVSDKSILQDYRAKIKQPMDLSTVQSKLDKGAYTNVGDFCLDVRRIFANCLRYNTAIKDSLRPVAVEVLQTAENLLKVFIQQAAAGAPPEASAAGSNSLGTTTTLYPPLVFCWRLCISILDTLYNLVNPIDGQPTALYFLYPVSYYCGGQFPTDYAEKVKKPVDYGTITGHLVEGRYSTVEEFASDCRLVLRNCVTYYEGRDDGRIYVDHATRLEECLSQQLDQLNRYLKSSKGSADRAQFERPLAWPRPPPPLLASIVDEMRTLKYTDKATKITEAAMGPFEKPVSLADFPDYLQHVQEPIDLQTVERKAKAGIYATPEDFEYDVNLIFKNCELYNSRRHGDHLVAMAKFGSRQFRRLFYAKIRSFEDPTAPQPKSAEGVSTDKTPEPSPSSGTGSPPTKKIKIEAGGGSKGKVAPRISISATQAAAAAAAAASTGGGNTSRSTTPRPANNTANQKKLSGPGAADPVPLKAGQPVPLHIAIARVKEAFPLRRAVKSLQSWESDCARYFKELMRHSWISAARPKFIFHVPVPILYPDLKDTYAAKIRKPMDLTTVECTLLAGGRYAGPEDFVEDIALVFANAVRFNKDARDIGDPLSCAYYDASVHLLRYSKWLSLELLSAYVQDSDHVDEPGPDGLPPFAWKLTLGNRKRAREEMEVLVMNELIEKSLEGDRWPGGWHETECEKLLKSLRHQSDLKYMSFFIQPNYPADYTAFISKPMDWEKVQRTLKKRQYDKFGDVIADLRLIFANALKYNARMKEIDPVSGRAYDAAVYMSGKLEAAINKLLLSVSDRLERERIDHANAEREIEAAERAEEAQIRAAWKKEPGKEESSVTAPDGRPDLLPKVRLIRRAAQRKEAQDFEIPFFDEEDTDRFDRTQSYSEVVKLQKAIYEKQRQERYKARQLATVVGSNIFACLLQKNMAVDWLNSETKRAAEALEASSHVVHAASDPQETKDRDAVDTSHLGSSVRNLLEQEGRGPIQVKIMVPKPAKSLKRKLPILSFE